MSWPIIPVDAKRSDWPRLVANAVNRLQGTAAGAGVTAVWGGITGTLSDQTDLQTALNAKQPLDGDLTALAALSGTNTIYYRSGTSTWSAVTIGTGLAFSGGTLSASGSGTVTSVSGAGTVNGLTLTGTVTTSGSLTLGGTLTVGTADISNGAVTLAKQADVATASVFYRKTAGTGAPEVQTLATLKTDLGLTGTNSGDQATIVGITGTKAQFDTACTDGNFLYVGDVTSYTSENARDDIAAALVAGTNITITPNDGADTITIAASGISGGDIADLLYGLKQYLLPAYGSATPVAISCVGVFTNASTASYATTNMATRRVRVQLSHSTANTIGVVRSNGTAGCVVGGTTQWRVRTRWSGVTCPASLFLAAGMLGNFSAAGEPSNATNTVIAGFDTTDSNVQVMHNDGSGTATKIDLGSNFPARTVGAYYEAKFEADGAGNIAYTVTRLDTGNQATGTISTNMPVENGYTSGLITGVTTAASWNMSFHGWCFEQNHILGY